VATLNKKAMTFAYQITDNKNNKNCAYMFLNYKETTHHSATKTMLSDTSSAAAKYFRERKR